MPENVFVATDAMIPPLGGAPSPVAPQQGFAGNPAQRPGGIPRFRLETRKVIEKDKETGKEVTRWVDVEFVDILTVGDNKASPCHKVTDFHRQLYAQEYQAWRRGLEMAPDGWPLEMWPVLSPGQVHAMKSINIFTVEQLAQVSDANLRFIPMGKTLRNQAEAALKAKKDSDSVESERRKNEMLQDGLRVMEDRLAAMQAQLDAANAAKADAPAEQPKRGPGRPKAAEAA